jgi:hypothetical protein
MGISKPQKSHVTTSGPGISLVIFGYRKHIIPSEFVLLYDSRGNEPAALLDHGVDNKKLPL